MNTVLLRLFVLSLGFISSACDNNHHPAAKKAENVISLIEPVMEEQQALKLNVDEAVLWGLETSADEPISLSDSVKLQIKPVDDQQRLSVSGKLLLQETWQPDYLDNIVGGKLELQLRFDD